MIYLVLSILVSSSLLIIFKFFDKYKIQSLQAIAINYITAAIVGLFFVDFTVKITVSDSNWILISAGLGTLFAIIFNLSKFTTSKVGMGITSVAMKLGVLFPVIIGILCYHEAFQSINYLGLAIGFASIYFINKRNEVDDTIFDKSLIIFPILVWIGSGVCDSAVQLIQKKFPIPAQNGYFSFITFASAGISSILFVLFKRINWEWKNIVAGIALGIPNYFSIYLLVKALHEMKITLNMDSSNLFMINNLSIVICSVVIGLIFFKEKLNKWNCFGIFLSLLSLYLINFK